MIGSSILFPDYSKSDDTHYHKQDDQSYPIINIKINDEDRQYYFKRQCYTPCSCEVFKVKFGYNPNNNGLSAYCIHCDYKHPKGLSQVKNSCKRDSDFEYSYFKDQQFEANRGFCEICLRSGTLKIHHIIEVKDNGSHEANNLQLLCGDCHNLVHAIRNIRGEQ